MPRVRYTDGGQYRVAGHTFQTDDEHDVSEGLASHLVDAVGSFERVDSDSGSDASDEKGETLDANPPPEDLDVDLSGGAEHPAEEPPFDPGEHTVNEIEDRVASGDYSDAELEALAEAERANDDRTTAIEAIEGA